MGAKSTTDLTNTARSHQIGWSKIQMRCEIKLVNSICVADKIKSKSEILTNRIAI